MSRFSLFVVGTLVAGWLFASGITRAAAPATLDVDATDVQHGIYHVHLTLPVSGGHVVLVYPKWVNNAVAGPLTQLVALHFSAGGAELKWARNALDAYQIEVDVPASARLLEASFDYLSPPKAFGGSYERSPGVTEHLLTVLFNTAVLYPAEADIHDFSIKAQVHLPKGWTYDTPLETSRDSSGMVVFPTVPFATLVDSPLLAGEFFRSMPVKNGAGATRLSIAADSEKDLTVSDDTLNVLRALTDEANSLFGARHYRHYVWLISLSEVMAHDGIEHHEATDIRAEEDLFSNPALFAVRGRLLAHEYVHSWNGKFRLPAGLVTRTYQEPCDDSHLWVYEGLTRYWGDLVLRGRSGMQTPAQLREYLAWMAGTMALDRPGRSWRSLADTAVSFPHLLEAPSEWTPIRRDTDFYEEMALIWLEADTFIQKSTDGRLSLDSFAQSFFGGASGAPEEHSYTRDDIVRSLNAVAPRDWDEFLQSRIDRVTPNAPLAGIEASGWRVVYDDRPNEYVEAREKVYAQTDLSYSIGLWVKADGEVADVVHDSPAFRAGLAPAMRILAISGHAWRVDTALAALRRTKSAREPIELVIQHGDVVRTVRVDYHDGLKYPHLERNEALPDLLTKILAPREHGHD